MNGLRKLMVDESATAITISISASLLTVVMCLAGEVMCLGGVVSTWLICQVYGAFYALTLLLYTYLFHFLPPFVPPTWGKK